MNAPGNGVRIGLNPIVKLALVAAAGAWAGNALIGGRLGASLGAGGAILLVESELGRAVLEHGAQMVRGGEMPPLADAINNPRPKPLRVVADVESEVVS